MQVLKIQTEDCAKLTAMQMREQHLKNRRLILSYLNGSEIETNKLEFHSPVAIKVVSALAGVSIYQMSKELSVDPNSFYKVLKRFKRNKNTRLPRVIAERLELFVRRKGLPLQLFDLTHIPTRHAEH